MNNTKRGISDTITILLLILLVILAITIIWYVASKFIKEQGEITEAKAKFFYEHYAITKLEYNPADPDALSAIKMTLSKKSGRTQLAGTEKITEVTSPVIDLISVVDLSSSMTQNNKIGKAKDANKELVNSILNLETENRIGIVGYDANIKATLDLTKDSNLLISKINELTTGSGTAICAGINEATTRFQAQSSETKSKLMIVMSDGAATRDCAGSSDAVKSSKAAIKAACDANSKLKNLIIYSIGFDVPSGSTAETTLIEIAKCGNGKYFKADVNEIIDIYQAVVKEIEAKIYKPVQIINLIRVVFYSSTNSYSEDIKDPPKEVHDTKTYAFNVKDKVPDLKKIEIYPVIVLSSGKEIIGPIIAKQEF